MPAEVPSASGIVIRPSLAERPWSRIAVSPYKAGSCARYTFTEPPGQDPSRQGWAHLVRQIARERAVVDVADERLLLAVRPLGKLDERARIGGDDHADAPGGPRG